MSNFAPRLRVRDIGDDDLGSYSRSQIISARKSLLDTVKNEQLLLWRNLRRKLGCGDGNEPAGDDDDDEHVWIPRSIPFYWSAPVRLESSWNSESSLWSHSEAYGSDRHSTVSANESSCSDAYKRGGMRYENHNTGQCDAPGQVKSRVGGHFSWDQDAAESSAEWNPLANVLPSFEDHTSIGAYETSSRSRKRRAEESEAWERSAPKSLKRDTVPETNSRYKMMYTCDLCSYISTAEKATLSHLQMEKHYSASSCLGFLNRETGTPEPKYLWRTSTLKWNNHQWKTKVPVCHVCQKVFETVEECAQHSSKKHNAPGIYTLRVVVKPLRMFGFSPKKDYCIKCSRMFSTFKMPEHTEHMTAQMGRSLENISVFLCQFCSKISDNYFKFKSHVFGDHSVVSRSMYVVGATIVLGPCTAPLTLLPTNQVVPLDNIDFDFSKERPDTSLEKAIMDQKVSLQEKPNEAILYPKTLAKFMRLRHNAIILGRRGPIFETELAQYQQQQVQKPSEQQRKTEETPQGTEKNKGKSGKKRRKKNLQGDLNSQNHESHKQKKKLKKLRRKRRQQTQMKFEETKMKLL